ncbi:MAG: peptidylprolyl isomerase [Cyanobacteria bacterium J06638_22]
MTVALTIGERKISADELMPLLSGYGMLPNLIQELIVDQAIAQWVATLQEPAITDEEAQAARTQFLAQQRIDSDEAYKAWLARHAMTAQQFETLALRSLRLEKFKTAIWGPKLESYFLSRKSALDKVIYSLIRTKDVGIAQELYFRIQDGEQSFAELAREYSQGQEAQTDGLIGPVELSVPHPTMAKMLSVSQPGQLWPPTRISDWMVIVRLERYVPVQMDDNTRQRLLNELFTTWLDEQLTAVTGAIANPDAPAPEVSAPLPTDEATDEDTSGDDVSPNDASDDASPNDTSSDDASPWDDPAAASSATQPPSTSKDSPTAVDV